MTINHLNSLYMWDFSTKKSMKYDFRTKQFCELPPAQTQRFGTNSFKYKGSLLWNNLSDDIKTALSIDMFKKHSGVQWHSMHVQQLQVFFIHALCFNLLVFN